MEGFLNRHKESCFASPSTYLDFFCQPCAFVTPSLPLSSIWLPHAAPAPCLAGTAPLLCRREGHPFTSQSLQSQRLTECFLEYQGHWGHRVGTAQRQPAERSRCLLSRSSWCSSSLGHGTFTFAPTLPASGLAPTLPALHVLSLSPVLTTARGQSPW